MKKLVGLEAAVEENNEMLRRLTLTASLQREDTSFDGLSLSPIETEGVGIDATDARGQPHQQ